MTNNEEIHPDMEFPLTFKGSYRGFQITFWAGTDRWRCDELGFYDVVGHETMKNKIDRHLSKARKEASIPALWKTSFKENGVGYAEVKIIDYLGPQTKWDKSVEDMVAISGPGFKRKVVPMSSVYPAIPENKETLDQRAVLEGDKDGIMIEIGNQQQELISQLLCLEHDDIQELVSIRKNQVLSPDED